MEMPTQKDFLFYSHTGLGDYIIQNGLIRKLYNDLWFDYFYLMTKDVFLDQIKFMYRDLDRIRFLVCPDDTWDCPTQMVAHRMFDASRAMKIKLFRWQFEPKVGGGSEDPLNDSLDYIHELYWYTCFGYSPSVRYNWFHVDRDIKREEEVFSDIIGNTYSNDYIFVADDPSRGYEFDFSRVKEDCDCRLIRSSDYLNYTLFDLLGVMEKAKSCHVMWSSFFMLCDGLNPGFTKLYLHETYLNDGAGKINQLTPTSPGRVVYENFLSSRNILLV
jgi:hypothetical protein